MLKKQVFLCIFLIVELVNKMYEWRKKNNINEILDNQEAQRIDKFVKKYFVYKLHKNDKFGRVFIYLL